MVTLLLLTLVAIYVFIPGQTTISKSVLVNANRDALFRKMQHGELWFEWWPGKIAPDTAIRYEIENYTFKPLPARALSVPVMIQSKWFETASEFTFLPINKDSTTVHIEVTMPAPNNPIRRLRQYLDPGQLEHAISKILTSIDSTFSNVGNLYDYNIEKKLVVDSILISTFEEMNAYPTIPKIYALIDQLKEYTINHGAKETGLPMLNISTPDSIHYLVRVAIPVNKRLPASGNISYKWMLGGGNILVTEVKGGPEEINNAYKQIINYIADHGRTAPAISFESLVTDRRNEPDSSKWITRIYYPVM